MSALNTLSEKQRVLRHCANCETPTTKRCSRCREIYYCSRECQVVGWKAHKAACKALPLRWDQRLDPESLSIRELTPKKKEDFDSLSAFIFSCAFSTDIPKPFALSETVPAVVEYRFKPEEFNKARIIVSVPAGENMGVSLTFSSDDGNKPRHLYLPAEQLYCFAPIFETLSSQLNGNQMECIAHIHDPDSAHQAREFWEAWKNSAEPLDFEEYEELIYGNAFECIKKLIQTQTVSRILEVCAGDGVFAKKVLSLPKVLEYHLLDFEPSSCGEARRRLSGEILKGRVHVHDGEITSADYSTLTQGKQMDLVIGLGAFCCGVLKSKSVAIRALSRTAEVLRSSGYLIILSRSSSFIFSEDLESAGFEVLNKAGVYRKPNGIPVIHPFYIARKR